MLLYLWRYFNAIELEQTKSRVGKAENHVARNQTDIQVLEGKINALALACHAMWELLEEQTNATSKDLEAKIAEIDMRDGRKDGKVSNTVTSCSSCGKKLNSRHMSCYWCGAQVKDKHPFS